MRAGGKAPKSEPPKSEKEVAKQKLIERIKRGLRKMNGAGRTFPDRTRLCRSDGGPRCQAGPAGNPGGDQTGRLQPVAVLRGPGAGSRPQADEDLQLPVLGKEYQAQRNRPRKKRNCASRVPCTMNGQMAAGEMNRYRFQATKGQRLVISAKARDLVPYVADGVPGWFQAVLRALLTPMARRWPTTTISASTPTR